MLLPVDALEAALVGAVLVAALVLAEAALALSDVAPIVLGVVAALGVAPGLNADVTGEPAEPLACWRAANRSWRKACKSSLTFAEESWVEVPLPAELGAAALLDSVALAVVPAVAPTAAALVEAVLAGVLVAVPWEAATVWIRACKSAADRVFPELPPDDDAPLTSELPRSPPSSP